MTSRLLLIQKDEIKGETKKSKKLDSNFNVHPFLQLLFIYLFRSHIYEVFKNLYCCNLSNKFAAKRFLVWIHNIIRAKNFMFQLSCLDCSALEMQTAHSFVLLLTASVTLSVFLFFVTTTPSSCVEMKNSDGWMRRTQRKDKELIGPAGGTFEEWKRLVLGCLQIISGSSRVRAKLYRNKKRQCVNLI